MIYKLKNYLLFALCFMLYITPASAAGPSAGFGLEKTAEKAGLIPSANNPPELGLAGLAGTLIGYLLAFVGVVFFVLMIYGGFLWMTSKGNDEQVKKSIEIIKASTIGIIVIFLSYVLTRLVITQLKGAVGI